MSIPASGASAPKKILFCKARYIGDTLLLTGTLRAVHHAFPSAEIWVAVREGTEGILTGCPEIKGIVTLAKPKEQGRRASAILRDLRAILRLRRERFDLAFELSNADRGRFVVALSGAGRKIANTNLIRSRFWRWVFRDGPDIDCRALPAASRDYAPVSATMGLPAETGLPPVFDKDCADFSFVEKFGRDGRILFAHPTASTTSKIWPARKWAELLTRLRAEFIIVLSCGPADAEKAHCDAILAAMPDTTGVYPTRGGLSWPQVAGALYSSCGYIGADTAAMHLASACRIPVLAIFGSGSRRHLDEWTPTGPAVRVVVPGDGEDGIADIPVTRVRAEFEKLLPRPHHA